MGSIVIRSDECSVHGTSLAIQMEGDLEPKGGNHTCIPWKAL